MSEVKPSIGEEIQEAINPPGPLEDEMQAMQWIVEGFEPLDRAARQRVLEWATARFKNGGFPERPLVELLTGFLQAVDAWQASIVEPTDADRVLLDAVLKGTVYEKPLPVAKSRATS